MAHTRAKIFDIIEKDSHNSITSKVYDVFMLVVIVLSIIPLMFTVELPWFKGQDNHCYLHRGLCVSVDYCRPETKQKRMVICFISSHTNGNNRHDVYFARIECIEPRVQDIQVVEGAACVSFTQIVEVY